MKGKNPKICAVENPKLRKKLTSDAQVSCARCGAIAHDSSSVCEPVALEPDH